jgi:hypothetical protein
MGREVGKNGNHFAIKIISLIGIPALGFDTHN